VPIPAVLVRHQCRALRLTPIATACLLSAFPAVFFRRVAPADAAFSSAAATGVPLPDRSAGRPHRETGHAIRFGSHLIAFIPLAAVLSGPVRRGAFGPDSEGNKIGVHKCGPTRI